MERKRSAQFNRSAVTQTCFSVGPSLLGGGAIVEIGSRCLPEDVAHRDGLILASIEQEGMRVWKV